MFATKGQESPTTKTGAPVNSPKPQTKPSVAPNLLWHQLATHLPLSAARGTGIARSLFQPKLTGAPAFLQGPVQVASEAEERKADALAYGGSAATPSPPIRNTAAPEGAAPGMGEPLPAGLRGELEASSGQQLDEIRVHRDESSATRAEALGA